MQRTKKKTKKTKKKSRTRQLYILALLRLENCEQHTREAFMCLSLEEEW